MKSTQKLFKIALSLLPVAVLLIVFWSITNEPMVVKSETTGQKVLVLAVDKKAKCEGKECLDYEKSMEAWKSFKAENPTNGVTFNVLEIENAVDKMLAATLGVTNNIEILAFDESGRVFKSNESEVTNETLSNALNELLTINVNKEHLGVYLGDLEKSSDSKEVEGFKAESEKEEVVELEVEGEED